MPGLRPNMSETKPHRLLPAKTMMLAQNTGVATISGVQFSSFCRYVENKAQIE